jgi:hypothetical protein
LTNPKSWNLVILSEAKIWRIEGFVQKKCWQRKTSILLLAVVLGAMCTGPAWAEKPLVLTQKDTGRTLTLSVGQSFVVDLNLGEGHYLLAPEFDPFILTLAGQSMQSTSGPKGSSSRVVYQFLVRQAGQTELVIAVKGAGGKEGKQEPLLKVKIVASGGGRGV